jgi:hypothetical protein
LEDFDARRGRWHVAWDRSGAVEDLLAASWSAREPPDRQTEYHRRFSSIWHYIQHAAVSTQRGQLLRACYYVDLVRTRAIELAALRYGLEAKRYRQVHQLPRTLRRQLAGTLPGSTEPDEILRALEVAATCFFEQAAALDAEFEEAASSTLAARMLAYVKHFRSLGRDIEEKGA